VPFARALIWPTYWIWYPGFILMLSLLPLYFPNGRLVSRGWRWVTRLVVVFAVCATGLAMVQPGDNEATGIPNPLGTESLSDGARALSDVLVLPAGWLFLGAVAVASLIVRLRRSHGEERQQLAWFVYAVVLFLLVNTVELLLTELLPSAVRGFLLVITLECVWAAIGIAILRYRLYNIDRIINRTLVDGSLRAMLPAVYIGGIVLLQRIFVSLTGEKSTLAVVASTLLIAGLFTPLRRTIQSFIERSFYRRKYDARKTLEAFSAKLREETDLDALTDGLVGVVKERMQPKHVSLWLHPDPALKDKKKRVAIRESGHYE
jgi:hypothetical protein